MTKRNIIFLLLFFLAGLIHFLEHLFYPYVKGLVSDFCFIVYTMIYAGLIMSWAGSVKRRLLPTRARFFTLAGAVCMLLIILVRTVKYRLVFTPLQEKWWWYISYVPILLIPMFFSLSCHEFMFPRIKHVKTWMLYVPVILLIVIVLTNDLHFWVFSPAEGAKEVRGDAYTLHFGLYLIFAVILLLYLYSTVVMAKNNIPGRKTKETLILVAVTLIYPFAQILRMILDGKVPLMYMFYELHAFCLLFIWEVCIRLHLIPYNANYRVFFENMQFQALITDLDFRPMFRSSWDEGITESDLRASLAGPVYPRKSIQLFGKEVEGGYAFWLENEETIERLNAQLKEIGETLEEENELIRSMNEVQEKTERMNSRGRIYSMVASRLLPTQEKIKKLLDDTSPESEDFDQKIALVSVYNAYIKRKTNLILLSDQKARIEHRELQLSLEESIRALRLLGISTVLEYRMEGEMDPQAAICLYDAFEKLVEQMLGQMHQLMVTVQADKMRIVTDGQPELDADLSELLQEDFSEEDIRYVTLSFPKTKEGAYAADY